MSAYARRAGILPAGCSGFQPQVVGATAGKDARFTGRLEALPHIQKQAFPGNKWKQSSTPPVFKIKKLKTNNLKFLHPCLFVFIRG